MLLLNGQLFFFFSPKRIFCTGIYKPLGLDLVFQLMQKSSPASKVSNFGNVEVETQRLLDGLLWNPHKLQQQWWMVNKSC